MKKKLLLLFLIINSTYALANNVILYVWDGLRPDSVTQKNTPNLYALMREGVQFKDNHSSFPTFTMMNAASFATGDFAGKTGFFGNALWDHADKGQNSAGKIVDFEQPVFTEDYKILQDLNEDGLFAVGTLFEVAHKNGLITAAIGKSGPAFLQDYKSQGIIFDEKQVNPLSFAQQLQQQGYALPKLAPLAFASDTLKLAANNGDPTAANSLHFMQDGVTVDSTDRSGSPYAHANQYMMNIYLQEILPKAKPQLSVVWMRDPDTTEHNYGPGTFNYRAALASNDKMLGELENKLKVLNLDKSTDIIVVSDHAHSHVSAPFNEFPLRTIYQRKVGEINANGYSVSGEIRTADLLTKAGFHAYDGEDCRYDPVLSGIKTNGESLYLTHIDKDGSICGRVGQKYITPAYKVPSQNVLPKDAIIIAENGNGGSEYFYVPSHDKNLIQKLVSFMQAHEQYGAIFVNDRYDDIAGTLSMSALKIQNSSRSPDIIASLNFDDHAIINGLPGIEFSDSPNYRGMHGSFSPIDVHNFLVAVGPDFQQQYQDNLPTGNVDVAPTIAHILGLNLPNTDGRVFAEALRNGSSEGYRVEKITRHSEESARGLNMFNALNQSMPGRTYTINLQMKILKDHQQTYTYFDYAKAIRAS